MRGGRILSGLAGVFTTLPSRIAAALLFFECGGSCGHAAIWGGGMGEGRYRTLLSGRHSESWEERYLLPLQQEIQLLRRRLDGETEFFQGLFRRPEKDSEIAFKPSASALPLKIFLDMGRVELQVPSSPNAADLTRLHPCVQGLDMAAEKDCGLICSEEVPDFEGTCLHESQY